MNEIKDSSLLSEDFTLLHLPEETSMGQSTFQHSAAAAWNKLPRIKF